MDAIQTEQGTDLAGKGIEALEGAMLEEEQVDCPVTHEFAEGLYIRTVTMPVGILAIGHSHKIPCWNEMTNGCIIIPEGKEIKMIRAPLSYVGSVGDRKIGFILDTVVWKNIWPNPDNERDIDVLEERYLDKSKASEGFQKRREFMLDALAQQDRDDFLSMIDEYGLDEETIRQQSENEADQIPMPAGWALYTAVRKSAIEGRGLFLSWPLGPGDTVAPARLGGKRTPAGRYVNHSATPNCVFVKSGEDIHLVAARDISGCKGGDKGEELTVNYRQALALSGVFPKQEEEKCQE